MADTTYTPKTTEMTNNEMTHREAELASLLPHATPKERRAVAAAIPSTASIQGWLLSAALLKADMDGLASAGRATLLVSIKGSATTWRWSVESVSELQEGGGVGDAASSLEHALDAVGVELRRSLGRRVCGHDQHHADRSEPARV